MLGSACREQTKFLSVGDYHFNHPGGKRWLPGALSLAYVYTSLLLVIHYNFLQLISTIQTYSSNIIEYALL